MRSAHDVAVDAPKDEPTVRAGAAIRAAREAKGLSQTELRDLLRERLRREAPAGKEQTVGQSAVSRWEQGVNAPEHWKWRAIEEVLEMEPGCLAHIILGHPVVPPDQLREMEARLDRVELALREMVDLLHGLDRRIQGTSPGGDEAG